MQKVVCKIPEGRDPIQNPTNIKSTTVLARLRKKMVRLVDYLQDDQNKFRPFQEYNRDIHRKEFGTDLLHYFVAGIFAKWHGRAVGCLSLQW